MLPTLSRNGSTGSSSAHLSRRGSGIYSEDYYSNHGSYRGSGHSNLLRYLRRVVYYPQMDFQYTFTQMYYLLRSPSKVYKLTSWRNQTKNQWARDDPAFVVLLCIFIAVAAIAYGLAFGKAGFSSLLYLTVVHVGIFFLFGFTIATFYWWLCNTYFRARHSHSVEQQVEWLYAFDIHCNGYFPVFLMLYVGQYLLMPLLLSKTFLATLAANALYVFALSYYHFISFQGYMYLPFLNKDLVTKMLYPIAVVVVLGVLFTVLNVNACRYTLSYFFD